MKRAISNKNSSSGPVKSVKLSNVTKVKSNKPTTTSTFVNNKGTKPPVGGNNGEPVKTDWNELKTQKKLLREQRKKKKTNFYETYQEAKKLWESLRCSSCKPAEREKLCAQILTLIKGNIKTVVKCHDTARIVQWLVKLGSDDVREQIYTEMSDDIVNMSKGKYTKHAVKSILSHCSADIKKKVIEKCSGNIYSMTCNKTSAPLIEEMFKSGGPKDRASMVKGFYGGMARDLDFDSSSHDEVTKALLVKSCKTLTALIDKQHCLELSLMHSVLYDYIQKCTPKNKTEMVNNLKTHFKSFLSSKDGVKLFSTILWESTAKEKKNIVKEFKTDIKEIAVGEYSSAALLLLMDAVDDTVLIKKALVPGLLENLESIAQDEHGRKVIIYLMVHRDRKYFHPKDIEWMSYMDSSPNVKKDSGQKIKELQEAVVVQLLEKISANPKFWFSNSSISMVTLAVLKSSSGEHRISAFSSIADYITDTDVTLTENDTAYPIIEHPGIHLVLKKIIANDKGVTEEDNTFSHILTTKLDESVVQSWIDSNRGCFTLISMFETNLADTVKELKKIVKKFSSKLDSLNTKGSEILKKFIS